MANSFVLLNTGDYLLLNDGTSRVLLNTSTTATDESSGGGSKRRKVKPRLVQPKLYTQIHNGIYIPIQLEPFESKIHIPKFYEIMRRIKITKIFHIEKKIYVPVKLFLYKYITVPKIHHFKKKIHIPILSDLAEYRKVEKMGKIARLGALLRYLDEL